MSENNNSEVIKIVIISVFIAIFIYVGGIVYNIISVYGLYNHSCELNSWMSVGYQRFYYRTLQHIEGGLSFFIKSPKVFDGFTEPPMPDNQLNDATLLGIDSNHDGIRDDVEIWINRNIEDKNLRLIFKQMARNEIFALYMTVQGNQAAMSSSYIYSDAVFKCALEFNPLRGANSSESFDITEGFKKKLLKLVWAKRRSIYYEPWCRGALNRGHNDFDSKFWKRCYSYVPQLEGKPYDQN